MIRRRTAGGLVVGAALALALWPSAVGAVGATGATERGEPDDANTVCVKINSADGEYIVPGSNCPPEAAPLPPPPPSPPSTSGSVASAPPASTTADPSLGVAGLPMTPPPPTGGAAPTTTSGPPAAPPPTLGLPPRSPSPIPIDSTTTPTTSTTSTTAATVPRRPPVTAPAPAPRLSVTASWSPDRPAAGDLATVTLVVRNDGTAAVDDLELVDEVGSTTQLRSATSDDGPCTTEGRRAHCQLGRLAPWSEATVRVRVLVDSAPASHNLVNRVSLSAGGHMSVEEQTISTLVAPGPTPQMALLGLSGSTVTLIVLVSFALACGQSRRSAR